MKPNPRDARLEYFAERSLEAHRLLPDHGPLLVAVSGGPDSVALLHFLAALQARTGRPSSIVAAHVNHGLRAAESDGDAAFVRDLAGAWGLAHVAADIGPLLRSSSEESARLARYDALRELAQEASADRVATAHTADDQAETLLLAYPKPLRTYLFRDAVQELNGDVRDLAATHLDALLSLVTTPSRRSADLPGGIRARRDGGRVLLELRIHEPAARKAPSNTG